MIKSKLAGLQALPYVLLAGGLMGSGAVVSRYALEQVEPMALRSVQLVIALAAFSMVYIFQPARHFPRQPAVWARVAVWGIIGTAAPMAGFIMSLKYLSSGVASLLVTLNPVLVMLLAHFLLDDEKLNGRRLIGALVALAGAAIIILSGENGLADLGRADPRGYAWIGLAAFSVPVAFIYARRFLNNEDTFDATMIRLVVAGFIFIVLAATGGQFDFSRLRFSGAAALIFTGLFVMFFALRMEFSIIKNFGPTAASQISYVIPVAATLGGAIFLGESITLTIIAGMICIFIGLRLLR
jgi:drug/metabolite transporter (DMT)-like permease